MRRGRRVARVADRSHSADARADEVVCRANLSGRDHDATESKSTRVPSGLGCFHVIPSLNYAAHVGTLASTHFGNSACLKNSALVCASGVNNSKLL
jgi:hypothetical protein